MKHSGSGSLLTHRVLRFIGPALPSRGRFGSDRRAFTLLEIILTLAMSVALMLLIGGAMQFYGRTMNVRHIDIQQTRLAAAVMQMIEDDLRATLYTRPVDTAGLEAFLAAIGGGDVGTDEDLPPDETDSDSADETDSDSPDESPTDDLLASSTVLRSPGLIGNQYQIQVDLSRLPRLEEYVAMFSETNADLEDVPSNIKTVSYHVQASGVIGGVQDTLGSLDPNSDPQASGGLVRRSLDRAATVEASLTGGLTRLNQTGELIAPEIIGIEFSYWDGITWLLQWNSDQYEELPMAVRVTLTMDDPIGAAASESQGIATSTAATRIFKHTIRLPLARPLDRSGENELAGAES